MSDLAYTIQNLIMYHSQQQSITLYNKTSHTMNYLNQQLHHKNTLVRTYEQQNSQLKSILNQYHSNSYQSSYSTSVTNSKRSAQQKDIIKLQNEIRELKGKIDQLTIVNTELVNKVEKEKNVSRRLERENYNLYERVCDLIKELQMVKAVNLAQGLTKGLIKPQFQSNMPNDLPVNSNNAGNPASFLNIFFPSQNVRSHFPATNESNQPNQMNLFSLIEQSFLQTTKTNPLSTKDMVISSLSLQKQLQQYRNQIDFLNKEIQRQKQSVQNEKIINKRLTSQVQELEQSTKEIQLVQQNDKLSGQVAKLQIAKATLQLAISKANQDKLTKSKELESLKDDKYIKLKSLQSQNQTLRNTIKREQSRRQKAQMQLKQFKNSLILGQSRKTIQIIEQEQSLKQTLSQKNQKQRKNSLSRKSSQELQLHKQSRQSSLHKQSPYHQTHQAQKRVTFSDQVQKAQDLQKLSFDEVDRLQNYSVHDVTPQHSIHNQFLSPPSQDHSRDTFKNNHMSKPFIKQTRFSFMIDDEEELAKYNNLKPRSTTMKRQQDSIVHNNALKSIQEENQVESPGILTGLKNLIFG